MNLDNKNSGNTSKLKWIAALAVTLIAIPASAHPGHGLMDNGIAHQLTSPYHVAISLLTGFFLLGVARFVRQPAFRRTLCLSGCGMVALAAVLLVLRNPAW